MEKKIYEVELRLTGFLRTEIEAENKDEAVELAIEKLYDSDYPNADDHDIEAESIKACDSTENLFEVELRLTSFVRIQVEAENAEAAAELAIEELYGSDHPNAQDHDIEVESIESIEDR